MSQLIRSRRWMASVTAVLLLGLVALLSQLGTAATPPPLWSETPIAAPATVPAPNWVALAAQLKPAVVNVNARRARDGAERVAPRAGRSLGSGFVINPDGHIVTNNHVVEGATDVRVKFSDGRELPARVVGRDPRTDIALLKVEATNLRAIPVGDSASLQVGEPVMAIGNPFGLEQTVTTGIVSATARVIGGGPYDDFIQTDAAINPGNSGGPLINARGQAIGINTAIYSQTGGSVGIGFAIPANLAKPIVAQLAATGQVVRGWLGVGIQPLTSDLAKGLNLPGAEGALVTSVTEGAPAERAGLKAGDVIVEYDGRKVARASELPRVVAETPVGKQVTLRVLRDGKPITLAATVAKLDGERQARATDSPAEPTLGIAGRTVTPQVAQELGLKQQGGVLVVEVKDGSRAEAAGLKPGDVIAEADRKPITGLPDLQAALESHPAGRPLVLLVHRDGDPLYLAVGA